jgi:hypothetical protein
MALAGTELATAQCGTIRRKLLKIGAQIRVTVRKVWVSLSSGYLENLGNAARLAKP